MCFLRYISASYMHAGPHGGHNIAPSTLNLEFQAVISNYSRSGN